MVKRIDISIGRKRYFIENPEAKEQTKKQLEKCREISAEMRKTDKEYYNKQLSGILEYAKNRTKLHKEELYDLYWNKKLDMKQIAEKLNVHYTSVQVAMKRYSIPRRSKKESQLLSSKRPEVQQALSERTKKMWENPEYRKLKTEQVAGLINPYYGKKHTDEIRQKMSNRRKELNVSGWKPHNTNKPVKEWISDLDSWAKNRQKGLHTSPNKPETIILTILNKLSTTFVYNGDGKTETIEGTCPDYIDIKNRKIIEFFGESFHNPTIYKSKWNKEMPKVYSEDYRRELFKNHGYSLLVIWDYELKNGDEYIINKIKQFIDS